MEGESGGLQTKAVNADNEQGQAQKIMLSAGKNQIT